MNYSKIPRVMLLTIAVLGLMSAANACEISGYKYQELSDGTPYADHPLQGWTIKLFKLVDNEQILLKTTTTNENGYYHFSEADLTYTNTAYGTFYIYEESRIGWTQVHPATGFYMVTIDKNTPYEGRKISGLGFVNQQDKVCYKSETAWTAGPRYVQKGNWATYTPYRSEEKTVDIFADQHINVGNAKFTANGNNTVTININLKNGASFADVKENLKIQGYYSTPLAKNPAPGKFTTYKGTISGNSITFTVPQYAYYGIHLDVKVPC